MIYLIFAQYMKYIMEQHSEYGLKTNSKVHEIYTTTNEICSPLSKGDNYI